MHFLHRAHQDNGTLVQHCQTTNQRSLPQHCTCVENIFDHDVQDSLEGYYKNHVERITEQLQRTMASKEHLIHYAASSYWEGKAELLKIPPHLMDLSAPLPPCVTHIVERQIDGMLEDFADLE